MRSIIFSISGILSIVVSIIAIVFMMYEDKIETRNKLKYSTESLVAYIFLCMIPIYNIYKIYVTKEYLKDNLKNKREEKFNELINFAKGNNKNNFRSHTETIYDILIKIKSNNFKDHSNILYSDLEQDFCNIIKYLMDIHNQDLQIELKDEIQKMLENKIVQYKQALEIVEDIEKKIKNENIKVYKQQLQELNKNIKSKKSYQSEFKEQE